MHLLREALAQMNHVLQRAAPRGVHQAANATPEYEPSGVAMYCVLCHMYIAK
jgi:hypothetical protein